MKRRPLRTSHQGLKGGGLWGEEFSNLLAGVLILEWKFIFYTGVVECCSSGSMSFNLIGVLVPDIFESSSSIIELNSKWVVSLTLWTNEVESSFWNTAPITLGYTLIIIIIHIFTSSSRSSPEYPYACTRNLSFILSRTLLYPYQLK